jgi:hypothetical protein
MGVDPAFFRMISVEAEAAASSAKELTSEAVGTGPAKPPKSSPLLDTRKSISAPEGGDVGGSNTNKSDGLEQQAKERFLSNPLQGMSLASIASAQRQSLDRVNMDFARTSSADSVGGGLDVIAAAAIYRSTERDADSESPKAGRIGGILPTRTRVADSDKQLQGRCVSLSVSMDSVRGLKRSLEEMDRETAFPQSMSKLPSNFMLGKQGLGFPPGAGNGDGLHTLLNALSGDPGKI